MPHLPDDIRDALIDLNLAQPGDAFDAEPLKGGVSSDIWRVRLASGDVCVKRALQTLRVSQEWTAPTRRHFKEAAWFRLVEVIAPGAAPKLLAHEQTRGVIVMSYLPDHDYPVWKAQLHDGIIDLDFVAQTAAILGEVHTRTAEDTEVRDLFFDPELFHALRLSPYFAATADVHADVAEPLRALMTQFDANPIALVHGDFSPKNILMGPDGPVILDAECANFGDPAFDVAFCLNHLLLKRFFTRGSFELLTSAFDIFLSRYRQAVSWEPVDVLEARTARYLAGLLLARIDGKSPVEYITADEEKAHVRTFAKRYLLKPAESPTTIAQDWFSSAPEVHFESDQT